MKTSGLLVLVALLSIACIPQSKHAGELVDSAEGSGSGESQGSGSGETDPTEGTTPPICVELGWSDSLTKFESGSASSNGTYYYTSTSGGPGFFSPDDCWFRTTIEAAGGVVVRRTLEYSGFPEGVTEEDCSEPEFVEEGAAVGTTETSRAADPYTMEELYAKCCELLAIEPADEFTPQFSVDE